MIWNDIQETRVSFWITKSGRSRTIPMTERVKEVIKLPPAEGRRPKGPFTKLSQAQFRAIWNDAMAEVGLGADDQVVPHILRHTCASRLVQGGIDIRVSTGPFGEDAADDLFLSVVPVQIEQRPYPGAGGLDQPQLVGAAAAVGLLFLTLWFVVPVRRMMADS